MADAALKESWSRTTRFIAASRSCLAEHLEHPEALKAEQEMNHYLHHREFGLALECAEELGLLVDAPGEYWVELKLAAENMGLTEDAARFAKLSHPSFQRTAARSLN